MAQCGACQAHCCESATCRDLRAHASAWGGTVHRLKLYSATYCFTVAMLLDISPRLEPIKQTPGQARFEMKGAKTVPLGALY